MFEARVLHVCAVLSICCRSSAERGVWVLDIWAHTLVQAWKEPHKMTHFMHSF